MSVKLQMQLENLEQKIGILTARLNQGDEWKRHLEFWLLDQLGMKFPDHLSMSDIKAKPSPQGSSVDTQSMDNNNTGSGVSLQENDENQCNNVIKNNNKRSLTPDGKSEGKPNKRRISSGINNNNDKPVVMSDPDDIITKEEEKANMTVSQPESESSSAKEEIESEATSSSTTTTTYIIQSSESTETGHSHPTAKNEGIEVKYEPVEIETVHSPPVDADNEVQVKYEPIEIENVPEAEPEDATTTIITTKNESSESDQISRQLPEQGGGNNVLHILKIDAEPLGGREPTVINYRQTLPIVQLGNVQSGSNSHTNSSQLPSNTATVFSGTIGADATTTTIGILNADGTITPCRQHVIISSSSGKVAVTTGEMQFKVVLPLSTTSVPLTTSTTTVTTTTPKAVPTATTTTTSDDPIDPKGTFVCSICDNKFQGLYLFRQHEKKSDCRRLAKIAKLKKSNNNIKNNNVAPGSSTVTQPPDKPSLSKLPLAVPTYVAAPPDNLPVLKFKCHICKSNYASSAYLKFHLSKIHNIP